MNENNGLLNSVSFNSPIIITGSIILLGAFTSTMEKSLFFLLWVFIITSLRIAVFHNMNIGNMAAPPPPICLSGISTAFMPNDITYSTYILSFTLAYFITPMMLLSAQTKMNVMNYYVLVFFLFYICLDIFVKKSLNCVDSIYSSLIIGDILSGVFLGACVSGLIMYLSRLKSYLYINEINSNKEICSLPSKQQFKCSVFKNGELVGNM